MTPESHHKICNLYHLASELAPAERSAFLDEVCGGDEALRREVESLLAARDRAGDYFAVPAMEVAAGLLAEENYPSLAGQSLSHYQVLSLIGKGGMGEVYLAKDTRLRRKVALKLLPAQFMQYADRARRFEREARAASSLNHPNVITIFEVGLVNGRHFISAEYIEGQTLRRRLEGDQLKLPGALDVAAQIASALAAAHEAGIVHRDIKPENIMLRNDGLVKVLDFGLAKLTEEGQEDCETGRQGRSYPHSPLPIPHSPLPLHYRSGDGDGTVHVARTDAWGGCRGAERYLQPWRSALRDDHQAAAVRGRDERRSGRGNPGARAAAAGAIRARSARRVAADRGEGAAQKERGSLRDNERSGAGSESAKRGDGNRNEGAAGAPVKDERRSPRNPRRHRAGDSGRRRHGYLQVD